MHVTFPCRKDAALANDYIARHSSRSKLMHILPGLTAKLHKFRSQISIICDSDGKM